MVVKGCKACVQKVELFSPIPRPPGGRRGWRMSQSTMANDLITHAYVMKPKEWDLESFKFGEYIEIP